MVLIFSVEGNIGSGKSTLVKLLKNSLSSIIKDKQFVFLQEPVDEWKNIKDNLGENIIEKFYKNQSKYSFSFQMMAYISRLTQLRKAIKDNPYAIIITERCLYTDRNVFAKMLFDDNKMEEVNYIIYNKWFHEFIKEIPLTGIIYLDTTPEKCSQRIKQRSRNGETIPLPYLTNCKKYHDNWIFQHEQQVNNRNIQILNGDVEFLDKPETLHQILLTVGKFILKGIPTTRVDFDHSTHIC